MAVVGLLFGSFNPIHTGHLVIAEYFASKGKCDRVELIVSPQNPLKKAKDLAPEEDRLAMARLAVRKNPAVRVNAIEFSLPKPSYTYHTLSKLSQKYPENTYQLIIGSDNFERFREWKDWERILEEYTVLAYRRPGFEGYDLESHPHVSVVENIPMIHLSATYIRECFRKQNSTRYLLPETVRKYVLMQGLYAR